MSNQNFRADDKQAPPPSSSDLSSASTMTTPNPHTELHGGPLDTPGGGAHDSPDDAFRAANGLDSPGRDSKFSVSQYSASVGQGEGISRGQMVKYTGNDGTVLQGGQYTNKDGTFFKTPEGNTYKVQQTDGKYSLQPTKEGQPAIEATSRDVIPNSFGRFNNRQNQTEAPAPAAAVDTGATARPAVVDAGKKTAPDVIDPATNPSATPRRALEQPVAATSGSLDTITPTPETFKPNPGPLTPAAARQFYDQYKGASDEVQNKMVATATQGMSVADQVGLFRQISRAGRQEDPADARSTIDDLKGTLRTNYENNGGTLPFVRDRTDLPRADKPDKPIEVPAKPLDVPKANDTSKLNETPAVTPGQRQQLQDVVGGTQKFDHVDTPAKLAQLDGSPKPVAQDIGGIMKPVDRQQVPAQNPDKVPGQGSFIDRADKAFDRLQGMTPGSDRPDKLAGGLDRGQLAGDKVPVAFDKGQLDRGPAQNLDRVPPGITEKLQNLQNQIADRSGGVERGRGGDNPGTGMQNPGRTRDGADGATALPTGSQKNVNGGFDLHDPQTKQFLADALKTIQANKVGDFDPRNQSSDLRDILKGFDPHRVERLQAFLNPDGKTPLNDAAVGRLAGLLHHSERITGTGATDLSLTLQQRTAIDRLTDFVRANQSLMDLQNMQMRDGRFWQDINRMVLDVNRQFGLDARNALTFRDIIGRSLDGTAGGERGRFEGRGPMDRPNLDPMSFTAKMTPMHEQALRAFLEAREMNRLDSARLAEMQHGMLPTTRPIEPTRPDLIVRTDVRAELANRPVDHKSDAHANKNDLANKAELPGKVELPGRADLGNRELAGKELPGKVEIPGRNEPNKAELAGKPDIIRPADHNTRHDGSVKDKSDRAEGLAGLAGAGKLDSRDHLDPNKKLKDERELAEKQKDERERLEEEAQRRESAMLALMADRKMRENKEKQEKEQERQQEKKQDEEARRRRYVVRERDTLESIAAKQLKDGKLAALIHELNIKEISLKSINGKEVPDLRPRQVIWLPSGVDIREYRKRMHSGSSSTSANDEKLSAEEELTARFGTNWGGTESGGGITSTGTTIISGAPPTAEASPMSPEAVAAAQKRRANIESLLGPISRQTSPDGRVRYVVRLGDTLKSVAMKHPAMQDITLWQLLAAINDIPTDTDEKGVPKAKLGRGTSLMMPTAEEIQEYRDANGTRQTRLLTKTCPKCGRASSMSASTCGGCAHSFNVDRTPVATQHDAGMVVMQAAGFVNKPGVPQKQPVITGSIESNEAPVIAPRLYAPDTQLSVTSLDERTRLARCIVHSETPCTVVAVEVASDAGWQPVVAYEIFLQSSMRHEYNPRGERKSVRIDLPTDATLELSNNDLTGNWKNYRDRFLAERVTLNR